MQTITEMAIRKAVHGIFTREQAGCWISGGGNRLNALLKRAVGSGEILRIHRGLYCLSNEYLPRPISPFGLAQRIHGPSYISFESALSYHGWIPEAVHAITSTSTGRSREFSTPLGLFTFIRIPQNEFFSGVIRISADEEDSFFIATPLKALCDYVYVNRHNWTSAEPLTGSLRIDEENLRELSSDMFDELLPTCKSTRIRRFLKGLRRDMKL